MKKLQFLALAIFALAFAACSDSNSTSTDQHEHFEAEGWNLYWPDWKLAYSVYQGKEDKSLETLRVNANCLSEHLTVKFLDDEKKEVSAPKDDEHTLGWSVGDESILDIEACGSWGFHLKGLKEGETTLILKVKHHDHADAKTPEIKIIVDKALDADKCPFQDDDDDDDDEHEHHHEHDHE